jgi:hypothetical protein
MRDDDTTDVRNLRRNDTGSTLFEVEPQTVELGDLGLETRSFVLAAAPLGEPVRRIPVPSIHQASTTILLRSLIGRTQLSF